VLAPAAPVTERLIGDLEIVPPREIAYRGITLKEMDPGAVWPSSMHLDTTHERWGILRVLIVLS
jgi:hypothetical protein